MAQLAGRGGIGGARAQPRGGGGSEERAESPRPRRGLATPVPPWRGHGGVPCRSCSHAEESARARACVARWGCGRREARGRIGSPCYERAARSAPHPAPGPRAMAHGRTGTAWLCRATHPGHHLRVVGRLAGAFPDAARSARATRLHRSSCLSPAVSMGVYAYMQRSKELSKRNDYGTHTCVHNGTKRARCSYEFAPHAGNVSLFAPKHNSMQHCHLPRRVKKSGFVKNCVSNHAI